MNYKNSKAPRTTITRNLTDYKREGGSIYETINAVARRANQINKDMKEELISKLNEFASSTDNLEEMFENREQIEISRFYERLPKPVAIALDEFMDDNIYIRYKDNEFSIVEE